GVPVDYQGDLSKLMPTAPRDMQPGFPITVGFPSSAKVTVAAENTSLKDAKGNKVPLVLARGLSGLVRVTLIPKEPLALGKTYTVEVAGTANGKAFRKKWTFHTMSEPFEEAAVAKKLVDEMNAARKAAGLKPVVLDAALSKACKAHALYLQT